MKTKIKLFIAVCFIFSIVLVSPRAYAIEKFSGTRNMVCYIDKSDMENYIEGGRAGFDYTLRSAKPEWLNYKFYSKGNDTYLEINFAFESYEDYVSKLTALLGYEPGIFIEDEGNTYIENFNALDLINFVDKQLDVETEVKEFSKEELFKVENSVLNLNQDELSSTKNIFKSSGQFIKLNSLNITTSYNSGNIKRTISGTVASEDENNFRKQLEKATDKISITTTGASSFFSIEFESSSINSIAESTMQALNIADVVKENVMYLDKENVKVNFNERFALQDVLEEGGSSKITYTFPTYYKNLTVEGKENLTSSGNTVYYTGVSDNIQVNYEKKLQFESVEVITDLSNVFGLISKTVEFKMPLEIATKYHTDLKEKLSENLQRGMVLDMYDDESYRYYEINLKTLFIKDLNNKFSKYFGDDYKLEIENRINPFKKTVIREKIDLSKLVDKEIGYTELKNNYVLAKTSFVKSVADGTVTDKNVSFEQKTDIKFEYTYINVVLFIVILLIALIIVIKIRKIFKKKNKKAVN